MNQVLRQVWELPASGHTTCHIRDGEGHVERVEAEKQGRDHALVLLLVAAVLVAYAVTGFGFYSLIQALV